MPDLETIKPLVYQLRPVLREITEQYGSLKLADYVTKVWAFSKQAQDLEFINCIKHAADSIYTNNIAEAIGRQLLDKPLVSTIDHLGIWGHPIFVNADLICSLHFKPKEMVVCLATESVSLNNTSSWSGSVLKHTDAGLRRYSFFSDKKKNLPVFSTPAITKAEMEKFEKKFNGSKQLLEIFNIDPAALNFSTQACQMSYNLWQAVFPSAPQLVYLPLESIVNQYILQIKDPHIIYRLIFSLQGQKLWKKYFGQEHTFMFWSIDAKGRRGELKNLPEEKALKNLVKLRKVYPSSPLCFAVLLLCGLTCVGGFTQTTWLTYFKTKFLKLLKELGAEQYKIDNAALIPTKNFAESTLVLVDAQGKDVQPTALDLLDLKKDLYGDFTQKAKKLTLAESLDLALPQIYEVVKKSKAL